MLPQRLRRARGPGRLLSTNQILGGSSVVIANGDTFRSPLAPGAFDFAGYDALALCFTTSNMAAGDSLDVRLSALDPESTTGAAVPSSLGTVALTSVTADGNYVATLELPSYYSSLLGSSIVPDAANPEEGGAWGLAGAVTKSAALVTNDGDTSYIQSGTGINGDQFVKLIPAAATPTSARVRTWARRGEGGLFVTGGSLWVSSTTQPAFGGGGGNGFNVDNYIPASLTVDYQELVYELTAGDIASVAAQPDGWGKVYIGFRLGLNNTQVANVTQTYIEMGGGGGGQVVAGALLPFYLNFFEFVNTGATPITIENVVAELTNS